MKEQDACDTHTLGPAVLLGESPGQVTRSTREKVESHTPVQQDAGSRPALPGRTTSVLGAVPQA